MLETKQIVSTLRAIEADSKAIHRRLAYINSRVLLLMQGASEAEKAILKDIFGETSKCKRDLEYKINRSLIRLGRVIL